MTTEKDPLALIREKVFSGRHVFVVFGASVSMFSYS